MNYNKYKDGYTYTQWKALQDLTPELARRTKSCWCTKKFCAHCAVSEVRYAYDIVLARFAKAHPVKKLLWHRAMVLLGKI
jgi:hypothetical protein